MVGITIFHRHTHSHTVTLASSFFLHLLSSSALCILSTLDQDPVTDPPKRDWLQEKKRILFAFPFCVCHYLSARSSFSLLCLSHTLPCLYFLLWVKFEKNAPLWDLSPTNAILLLPFWWILKARGNAKVQIRFFWELFCCGLRPAHVTPPFTGSFALW